MTSAHTAISLTSDTSTTMAATAGNPSGLPNMEHWSTFIGIATAIAGNILISFALNLQRYAHTRIAREQEDSNESTTEDGHTDDRAHLSRQNSSQKARHGSRENVGETAPLLPKDNRDGRNGQSNGQTNGHKASSDERDCSPGLQQQASYLQSPYWWLGIVLMTLGEAGNFLAYGFAPASIVSPLGVVALISNCLIAPILLKEKFRARDLFGVLIATAGAVTIVMSAKDNNPKIGPHMIWRMISTWEFELYFALTVVLIAVLMAASSKHGQKSILIDVGLVALFGGYTALSTKGVASLLSYKIWRVVTFPVFYLLLAILISTAVLQIKYINRALQRFDATEVIPTQFVLFTISVIVGSAILYRDFERTEGSDAAEFFGGCLLTFAGVWLITSLRDRGADDGSDDTTQLHHRNSLADTEEEQTGTVRRRSAIRDRAASAEDTSEAATPGSRRTSAAFDASSPLNPNPWARDGPASPPSPSERQPTLRVPHLQTTISSPVLPSESRIVVSPPPADNSHALQPPVTPQRSISVDNSPMSPPASGDQASLSQAYAVGSSGGSFGDSLRRTESTPSPSPRSFLPSLVIVPNPLTGTLSGSLSAVVADSLRRGFNTNTSPQQIIVAGPPAVRRDATGGSGRSRLVELWAEGEEARQAGGGSGDGPSNDRGGEGRPGD